MSHLFKLYDYTRIKVKNPEANISFWKGYMKKYMQSMARSNGRNVHRNKWFCITQFVFEDIEDISKRVEFITFLEGISNKIAKKFKMGHLRTMFTLDLIKLGIHAGPMNVDSVTGVDTTYQRLADKWYPEFFPAAISADNASQKAWFINWCEVYNFERHSCGHYEDTNRSKFTEGNASSIDKILTACQVCANQMLQSGERVHGRSGRLILAEFAVTVFSRHNSSYIDDRRRSIFSFHEARGIWVDQMWTPYGDLLGSYHSSRNKGFDIVSSDWFLLNRRAFGIELEVQLRNGDLDTKLAAVHEALNYKTHELGEYCYFERDGSIGEGFEIVSQPAGLDVHRDRLGRFLNNGKLKMGLRSHEGGACGLHVHVGREFLTQAQIYRVQSFLNDVRNEALIRSVARRYDNNYCRFKPYLSKFTVKGKHSTERYEALNVTNADTIEFRIFRGSLRYESIMAALEFVNALLTFCTPGEVSLTQFTAIGFKDWLMKPERKAENRFLRSYLSLDGTNDNEQNTTQQAAAA